MEVTGEVELPKADYVYKIVCLTFNAAMRAKFSLSVFCNQSVHVEEMPSNQTTNNNTEMTQPPQRRESQRIRLFNCVCVNVCERMSVFVLFFW